MSVNMDVENKKNKIITISGEPVTGKGTNVKAIKQKLLDKGYKNENIHIFTTGHEFRKYFEVIIEFIKNLDNEEALKKLYEKSEIKSIFENPKYRNKFIKELSKLKSTNKEIFNNFSVEQQNNIPQLSGIREIVDSIIDENTRNLGIEINKEQRPDEIWIIDSRLAFNYIPNSLAVRLTCIPNIAGKRLFEDKTRGKEDSKYETLEDAIKQREKRRIGEIQRYKQRYGIDLSDEGNYDLIIDTSYSDVDDISDVILSCLDKYQKGEYIHKNWTSIKSIVPSQTGRETWFESCKGFSLKDIKKSIEENGFNQENYLETVEVDGILYLRDGHHRGFASACAKKTLVPYCTVAKDDENLPDMHMSARDLIKGIKMSDIYDHEEMISSKFRYTDVYPDLEKKLRNGREDLEH